MKAKFVILFAVILITMVQCTQDNKWFKKGMEATDPKEKIECFTKSIEKNPTADAYWFRYRARREINDTAGMSDDLGKAMKLDGKYLYYEKGIVYSKEENFREALECYSTALELGFSDTRIYIDRGYAKHQLMDCQGALDEYAKYIKLKPKDGLGYEMRGNTKVLLHDYNGAIRDYDTALLYSPELTPVYFERANSKYYIEDFQGAFSDFSKCIDINPKDTNAHYFLGNCYFHLGQSENAIAEYTIVTQLDSSDVGGYYNRGYVNLSLLRYDEAFIDFRKVIELNQDETAYEFLGYIYLVKQKYDSGIYITRQGLIDNPNNCKLLNNLGYCYLEKGEYEKSIENFTKSFNFEESNVDTVIGLTAAYFSIGDVVNAKRYLKMAELMEPRLTKGQVGVDEMASDGYFISDKVEQSLRKMFEETK